MVFGLMKAEEAEDAAKQKKKINQVNSSILVPQLKNASQ